jgi:hypothetical protein
MKIINLNEQQLENIEDKLNTFDENYITYKMDGSIQIGIEEDGRLVAGLDACVTAFKILYVSTVFVDEEGNQMKLTRGNTWVEVVDQNCDLDY